MAETAAAKKRKHGSLDDAVQELLARSQAGLIAGLPSLIENHGEKAVKDWKNDSKHKHRLVHEFVRLKRGAALTILVQKYKFNINVPRESDECTALHLSAWMKLPELTKTLLDLGADPTLKNKYGEDCAKLVQNIKKIENLVFLDLELTNLPADGPSQDSILECAVVVTDKNLLELGRSSWVVSHSESCLNGLSSWHQKEFAAVDAGGNGLFAAVRASTTSKEDMKKGLLALLQAHCVEGHARLAGNSVHCDREVLLKAMPEVYKFCSHQVVDVSTLIHLARMWNPDLANKMPPAEGYNHRAEGDINACISTLKWFKPKLFA